MPHKTEEDLSETKSISAKNKKIQIALGICLAPCIGSRRDRFPSHDIFFASGRTNRAKSENSKPVFFWASSEVKRTTVREISLWREPTHSFTRSLISLISSRIWLMTLPGPFRSRASVILIDSPLSLSTSSIFPKWSFPSMIWKASV